MQFGLQSLLVTMVMGTISAAPSPEPQLSPQDAAVSVFGPMVDLSPDAAQATCGGAPAFALGSNCVGQGGKFACDTSCNNYRMSLVLYCWTGLT